MLITVVVVQMHPQVLLSNELLLSALQSATRAKTVEKEHVIAINTLMEKLRERTDSTPCVLLHAQSHFLLSGNVDVSRERPELMQKVMAAHGRGNNVAVLFLPHMHMHMHRCRSLVYQRLLG